MEAKMKLKRYIILLISVMILALAGCDTEDSASQSTVAEPRNTATTFRHLDSTEQLMTVNTFRHRASFVVQESDDIPLLTNVVSEDMIREITRMICVGGWASYGYVEDTVIGLNDIAAVEELRQVEVGDKVYYYCVYGNESGGKLYVFFDDGFFWSLSAVYSEKRLIFDDFLSLKAGVSTKDDVAEIDPSTSLDIKQKCDEFNGVSRENSTFHMTAEGYVEIRYTKDNVVEKIIKKESGLIQSINENDL
jgi:hypothetical protein